MRELDYCYFIEGETLSAFLAAGRPAGKREKGYEENVGNVIAAMIAYYPSNGLNYGTQRIRKNRRTGP